MIRSRPVFAFVLLAVASLAAILILEGYSSFDKGDLHSKRSRRLAGRMDFKHADFSQPAIPQEVLDKVNSVSLAAKSASVLGVKVHVLRAQRSVSNSTTNVLLLHGQAFSSDTWADLGTIQHLAAMGYEVAAVDLPGYGKTPSKGGLDKAMFLEELMSALSFRPQDTVVVSPSMSGAFSLALLNKHPNLLKGFVPVAPVGTDLLKSPPSKACGEPPNKSSITHPVLQRHASATIPDLSCYATPTLVVFGEKDSSAFLYGCALLSSMPRAVAHMIPNARHPAYLDNPQLWHTLLYNFLDALP